MDDPDSASPYGESVVGPIVDIGAHEFQVATAETCPADTNGDGVVNVDDVVAIILAQGPLSLIEPERTTGSDTAARP